MTERALPLGRDQLACNIHILALTALTLLQYADVLSTGCAASAVSLALGTHWVCNFAIGQLFLPAVMKFGVPGVYLFFSAVCVAGIIFQRAALVETKGLSLEQIEKAMAG
jgi:hypothetical protein